MYVVDYGANGLGGLVRTAVRLAPPLSVTTTVPSIGFTSLYHQPQHFHLPIPPTTNVPSHGLRVNSHNQESSSAMTNNSQHTNMASSNPVSITLTCLSESEDVEKMRSISAPTPPPLIEDDDHHLPSSRQQSMEQHVPKLFAGINKTTKPFQLLPTIISPRQLH